MLFQLYDYLIIKEIIDVDCVDGFFKIVVELLHLVHLLNVLIVVRVVFIVDYFVEERSQLMHYRLVLINVYIAFLGEF